MRDGKMPKKHGRPRYLDEKREKEFVEKVKMRARMRNSIRANKAVKEIIKLKAAQAFADKTPFCAAKGPCRQTISNIFKRNSIHKIKRPSAQTIRRAKVAK